MHLATRLGTGATRVAPQDEKTEETEEGEAQWPTSGSAGSWWSVGESWSHWQYNWQSNWGGGSASGESWTALHSSSSSRSHSPHPKQLWVQFVGGQFSNSQRSLQGKRWQQQRPSKLLHGGGVVTTTAWREMDPVALMMQMPWHSYTAGGQCWFKMPKAEERGRQAALATRLAQGENKKKKDKQLEKCRNTRRELR